MIKAKLAQGIAMALAIGAADGANASTTMYNMFQSSGPTATDGWTTTLGSGQVPADVASGTNLTPWVGTSGQGFNDVRPFNYSGQAALSWAIQLNGSSDNGVVSAWDSAQRYSPTGTAPDANYAHPAEIDTGGGAWQDNSATPTGWKHQTDIGLLKSDVTQTVTLYLAATGQQAPTFSTFGVTVFEGVDTTAYNPAVTQTKYSHHGAWNCPTCTAPKNFADSNPWYRDTSNNIIGTGMTYLTHSNAVDAVTGITFTAQAGQVYTIALGGVGFSKWNTGVDGYVLGVNTAPVPIPAAAWLFGSALAGMGVIGRRKNQGETAA